MSMENTPNNLSEIHWLRLDKKCPSKVRNWFKLNDSNKPELIEKCQKLEDVENAMQDKCRKPAYRYTKVELLRLQDHPLSQKPPIIADSLKSLCGKTASKDEQDPKKEQYKKTIPRTFAQGKKHDGKENDMSRLREKPSLTFRNEKLDERKPTDPASRIRKEQDICLSPQRKSFTTGCFVQNAKGDTAEAVGNSTRKNSESNSSGSRERNDSHENQETREKREIRADYRDHRDHRDHREQREHRDHRESKDNRNSREPVRRIGSGRLLLQNDPPPFVIKGYPESRQMTKDKPTVVYKCTFPGKTNDREKDSVWNRQKNVNYFDRRKNQYSDHSHDDESNKYTPWDQHRNNNFFERRRPYHNDYHRDDEEEKEPEWMKEGPGSKNDMIELKGFDESVERFFRGGRKIRSNQETNKNAQLETKEISKRTSESDASSVMSDSVPEKSQDKSTENKPAPKSIPEVEPEKPVEEKSAKPLENHSIELNLDEIFKEPLLDLNTGVDSNESAGSKFTRWFKRDDANPNPNAVPSTSLNESLQSLISGASDQSPKVQLPMNSVAPTDAVNQQNAYAHSSNLMDLLRGSQENSSQSKMDVRTLEATGKLHSLEEIEAKWRGADKHLQAPINSAAAVDRKKKEEEAEAFKKLLSQALKHDESIKAANDNRFPTQKDKNESGSQFQQKTDLSSVFCNGDAHPNFPPNMLPPQVSRMLPLNNVKQFPMQQNKQDMLSKMFMSNNTNFASSPQQSGMRAPNASISSGVYSPISPEIQNRINECQPTRELLQRQETINMLKALKKGDLSIHHLVEQYKKTTPSQLKFRESVICVLKIMQQAPYGNSSPYMGSPMGMSFNIPPPPHSPQLPYNENVMQQMLMNSQYRSGVPNIVYQRDFSGPNQNMFQNNMNKKLQAEQSPNINQMPARMNSPLTIGVSSMSNVPGSNSMSPSGSINLSRDAKNNMVLSMKSTTSQSHSFTPISVLRQLSADKENMDTMSRDSKDTKLGDLSVVYSQANASNMAHSNPSLGFASSLSNTMQWNAAKQMSGEKNALVPYSASNSNQYNSVCISAGVIEHLNSFGSCIPPPAISGQYFVGNMIRPSNMSSSIPIFSNPPPPILSRLPVTPNANLVAKGSQKLSINPSQLQQMQQMRAISSHIPQSHESYVSSANRTNSDGIISSSACGNQNTVMRNSFMNGLLPSGEDQLNRLFSNSNVNSPSFSLSNSNVPVSVPNIISVEEIERLQQSVRN